MAIVMRLLKLGRPRSAAGAKQFGAGEGNRTLVCSLGSCRSTIELRPHSRFLRLLGTFFGTNLRPTFWVRIPGPLEQIASNFSNDRPQSGPVVTRSSGCSGPSTRRLKSRIPPSGYAAGLRAEHRYRTFHEQKPSNFLICPRNAFR